MSIYDVTYEVSDDNRIEWIIRQPGFRTSGREDTIELARMRVKEQLDKLIAAEAPDAD